MFLKNNVLLAKIVFALLFFASTGYGQAYKNEMGFKVDNDMYIAFNQDRYYTNGTFGYFRHAIKQDPTSKFEKKILDFEIGQKIYNPYRSYLPNVTTHDRPFAGYLYGSAALSWFKKNEDIIKASVQVGVIGPASFAKEVQTDFHKYILHSYHPVQGWEYQIKNEPALNFDVSYQHLFYRTANRYFDLSGTFSVLLGNTYTGAHPGLMLRFGKLNPFYESAATNSRIRNEEGAQRKPPVEFFLFTQPQIHFVAYDATIQGGLFRSDKGPVTFGIKHWVYSQLIGLNFAANRFNVKYIVTLRTKEVKSNAKAYQYGSIGLSYSFK